HARRGRRHPRRTRAGEAARECPLSRRRGALSRRMVWAAGGAAAAAAVWIAGPRLLRDVALFRVREVEVLGARQLPPRAVAAAMWRWNWGPAACSSDATPDRRSYRRWYWWPRTWRRRSAPTRNSMRATPARWWCGGAREWRAGDQGREPRSSARGRARPRQHEDVRGDRRSGRRPAALSGGEGARRGPGAEHRRAARRGPRHR